MLKYEDIIVVVSLMTDETVVQAVLIIIHACMACMEIVFSIQFGSFYAYNKLYKSKQ